MLGIGTKHGGKPRNNLGLVAISIEPSRKFQMKIYNHVKCKNIELGFPN